MIRVVNDPMTIAGRLRPVLLRLARELRREIHSLGVTGGQVSLLASIKHNPGITATELAERERVSAPGMSGHLVRLEAAQLIERTRATDRRRIGLFLDARGRQGAEVGAQEADCLARRAASSAWSPTSGKTSNGRSTRWRSCWATSDAAPPSVAPHVRLAEAPPQLPPLLLRPAHVRRRDVDAEHRDGVARRDARTTLARPRRRPARGLPLRPVHGARPLRRASSPTASTTAAS